MIARNVPNFKSFTLQSGIDAVLPFFGLRQARCEPAPRFRNSSHPSDFNFLEISRYFMSQEPFRPGADYFSLTVVMRATEEEVCKYCSFLLRLNYTVILLRPPYRLPIRLGIVEEQARGVAVRADDEEIGLAVVA